MKQAIFRREARWEALEAYRWYEDHVLGLGDEFRAELDATISRICEMPDVYRVVERGTRRARLHRFPYSVFFREYDEAVVIVAVFHAHRDPSVWRRRAR